MQNRPSSFYALVETWHMISDSIKNVNPQAKLLGG